MSKLAYSSYTFNKHGGQILSLSLFPGLRNGLACLKIGWGLNFCIITQYCILHNTARYPSSLVWLFFHTVCICRWGTSGPPTPILPCELRTFSYRCIWRGNLPHTVNVWRVGQRLEWMNPLLKYGLDIFFRTLRGSSKSSGSNFYHNLNFPSFAHGTVSLEHLQPSPVVATQKWLTCLDNRH